MEKRCTKCRTVKDLEDFGPDKRARDGKQSACKLCCSKQQSKRREDPARRAEDRERIKRAEAKRPEHYRELHNSARQQRRANPEYRAAELAAQREWRAKNGNMARSNHARRARKLAAQVQGPVPSGTYEAVLLSGPCVYCGAPATTVDHVTPLARGGHEAEYNLVPACSQCNTSKGPKLLNEWDPARVTHAIACDPKIQEQLAWQEALAA